MSLGTKQTVKYVHQAVKKNVPSFLIAAIAILGDRNGGIRNLYCLSKKRHLHTSPVEDAYDCNWDSIIGIIQEHHIDKFLEKSPRGY